MCPVESLQMLQETEFPTQVHLYEQVMEFGFDYALCYDMQQEQYHWEKVE